jgi:alkane 1-monooxygenase
VLIPYSLLPLHLVVLVVGLHSVAHREAGALWLVYAVPVGLSGSLSLLIAHEFMHMYSSLETFLSRAAGACQFWGVHELEHLQIHHRLDISCTEEDTSYAKLGQSIYSYIALSIFHNYRNAWRTERELMQRKKQRVVTLRNRVVRTVAFSILATLVTWLVFGLYGMLFFLIQAIVSMVQFMMITYNQHYGLTRRRRPDGTYEPFTFMNTWSSDLKISNWMTANLATHAHHHLDPFCPYYNLKLIEGSPILPFGYLVMSLIAMIPSLWFRVMDKRVNEVFERRDRLEQVVN